MNESLENEVRRLKVTLTESRAVVESLKNEIEGLRNSRIESRKKATDLEVRRCEFHVLLNGQSLRIYDTKKYIENECGSDSETKGIGIGCHEVECRE